MEQNNQTNNTKPERTDWKTTVRCWRPIASDGSVNADPVQPVENVTIPEEDPCVRMPDFPAGPLGRPIDANVAVTFISKFFDAAKTAFGLESDADVKKLSYDDLLQAYFDARKLVKQLKDLNYGMTIDKNFALKLLSQPKCEGIRGYLCYKPDNDDYPFSLVTVGVNEHGFDLRYNKAGVVKYQSDGQRSNRQPIVKGSSNVDPVDDVSMESLTGEYITPPYTLINAEDKRSLELRIEKKIQQKSRFVLLNIARGEKV